MRCLNSEQSWYYSRHCRYSWQLQGTERKDLIVCCVFFFNLLYFVTVYSHSRLTWIFMATSLPSFSLAKCTWPIDAAANGFSSKYSSLSLQFGPRSLLTAFCREKKRNCLIYETYWVCVVHFSSPYCTIICLIGMKSALCRTRSKILANWGLIKTSSERGEEEMMVWNVGSVILEL